MHGFRALEKFLLFASRTQAKIYWLVSCTLYSWEYLDKVLQVSKYFHKTLWLRDFPQEEVENIVLKRHRVSGYKLLFNLPEEISKSKKFKKLRTEEEQQSFLQSLFFKNLDELSKGNITITLLFWLRAIQELSEDKISIYPLITFDFSFLNQLPAEEIFTLAAFMQHENLKTAEFSEIFNQNIEKTSLLLTRFFNSGILLKNERGFHIHPFLYRSIVRILKSKNLLH